MDLLQLKYFARVAQSRSFTRAAQELHVAQPALTRHIRLLEEELGVTLLKRHSRGAEPTDEGRLLLERVQQILGSVGSLKTELQSLSGTVSGTVRFAFPPSIGLRWIGRLAEHCNDRYPGILLDLREAYTQHAIGELLAGRLDLAVLSGEFSHPLLELTHLMDEPLWLVMSPALSEGTPGSVIQVEQLAGVRLIQPSHDNLMTRILNDRLASLGLAMQVVIQAEPLPVIKDLVRRGLGGHVSPYAAVAAEIEEGTFIGRPVHGLSIRRYLAMSAVRASTRACLLIAQLVRDEIGSPIASARVVG